MDKTLMDKYDNPLIIESTTNIYPLKIYEGALMLTEKYTPLNNLHLKFVILPGSDYRVFKYMEIAGKAYFHFLRGNKLITPDPKATYYSVRWILQ